MVCSPRAFCDHLEALRSPTDQCSPRGDQPVEFLSSPGFWSRFASTERGPSGKEESSFQVEELDNWRFVEHLRAAPSLPSYWLLLCCSWRDWSGCGKGALPVPPVLSSSQRVQSSLSLLADPAQCTRLHRPRGASEPPAQPITKLYPSVHNREPCNQARLNGAISSLTLASFSPRSCGTLSELPCYFFISFSPVLCLVRYPFF